MTREEFRALRDAARTTVQLLDRVIQLADQMLGDSGAPPEPDQIVPEGSSDTPRAQLQAPELPNARAHRVDGLAHVVIPADREYLLAIEAAAYVRCASVAAFYHWYRAHHVPAHGSRGARLFKRADLDRALEPVGQPKRSRYFNSHRRSS